MTELLAAVQNTDQLRRAVLSGADAVSLHPSGEFSPDALRECIRFCRVRGVFVRYAPRKAEEHAFRAEVRAAVECGADAILTDSPAFARLCRRLCPDVAVHASEKFGVHSLSGVRFCEALGISRVCLPAALPEDEALTLSRFSSLPLELTVFGDGCRSADGCCYLSYASGTDCENCPAPCRKPFGYGRRAEVFPLAAPPKRDLPRAASLAAAGARILRVCAGEYTAETVRFARAVLDRGESTAEDVKELEVRLSLPPESVLPPEKPRVPISFTLSFRQKNDVLLTVTDDRKNTFTVRGENEAGSAAADERQRAALLRSECAAPYAVKSLRDELPPDTAVSELLLKMLLHDAENRLTALRGRAPERRLIRPAEAPLTAPPAQAPVWTASVTEFSQITSALLELEPAVLFVPLSVLRRQIDPMRGIPQKTTLCAVLPRMMPDGERTALEHSLRTVREKGIREALCSDLGQFAMLRRLGFSVRWDAPHGVRSDADARFWADGGCLSALIAPDLPLSAVRELYKPLPLEYLAYGRLPLLLTNDCLIRARSGVCACTGATVRLTDREGGEMPILPEGGTCRNLVYSSQKRYLLDRRGELAHLGLWALRLAFTTEHPSEIDILIRRLRREAPPGGALFRRRMTFGE